MDAWTVTVVAIFGAIVGSFLNVVIFRLPRDQSVMRPVWSFCPHCNARIGAIDNVPVLSWLFLRGRCRNCSAFISDIYPLIECLTALVFVMIWDGLLNAHVIATIEARSFSTSWPIIVAYLSLFAGLLATATMDIESYMIDIRILVFVMIVGVAGHAAWWGKMDPADWAKTTTDPAHLPAALCLVGVAMGATWAATALVASRVRRHNPQDGGGAARLESDNNAEAGAQENSPLPTAYLFSGTEGRFRPIHIVLLVAIILGLTLWSAFKPDGTIGDLGFGSGQRGFIACFVFMLVLILASMVRREADEQIVEELEAERHTARSIALGEFAYFIPAIAVGVGLLVYFRLSDRMDSDWHELLGSANHHVAGASVAIAGMAFGATLGWTVRILGTLSFGKEAFGSGDIFIMAAIGAVGGLWMVVFSFFLAALLTLIGVLATLFRKSSRAIPFGPWLALGAFVAMYLHDRLVGVFAPYGPFFWWILSGESIGL